VIDVVWTFVIASVDGVVFAPLTKPVQPLKNAAEAAQNYGPTAHTHPLTSVFTFLISFWA